MAHRRGDAEHHTNRDVTIPGAAHRLISLVFGTSARRSRSETLF